MSDLVVPSLGESITEAVISRWMKNVGERVEVDEPVLELESDKVTLQLPSPIAGVLGARMAEQGQAVKVGEVVGRIEPEIGGVTTAPGATAAASAAPKPAPAPSLSGNGGGRLTPSMRRAQREAVPVAAASPVPAPPAVSVRTAAASVAQPATPTQAGAEEVVLMSPLRKRIAARLVEAQHAAAALTTFNEVDMSSVMAMREAYKQDFVERHGVKLGFMSFFVKACVSALSLYRGLNAEVRGDAIVYKHRHDLGIAVSTERGLVVPVLRGCEQLGFAEIERGIAELAARARASRLTIEDLTGGTFTITNGGIYGSMMSTPLLNHPQTGILGMHNITERAIVIDGKVEVRPMMYLALTYDHRVVDGKEAVSFLLAVKQRIERPDRLLLGL